MEVPEGFRPKKNSEEYLQELLKDKPRINKEYGDAVFFQGLSFKQLGKLVELEDKMDHLQVDFEYKDLKYRLTYIPDFDDGSMLQLSQKSVYTILLQESLKKLKDLAWKVEEHFHVQFTSDPVSVTGVTDIFMIDFLMKKHDCVTKKLEHLFDIRHSKFKNIEIYVEYYELTNDDMKYLRRIPRKHMLKESRTYNIYKT